MPYLHYLEFYVPQRAGAAHSIHSIAYSHFTDRSGHKRSRSLVLGQFTRDLGQMGNAYAAQD